MSEQQTPSDAPAPVTFHWIMTVQTETGRQGTNDGSVAVTPGVDTDESTYTSVLRAMRQWVGVENVTVLYYRLAPSAISAPAVAA